MIVEVTLNALAMEDVKMENAIVTLDFPELCVM